MKSFLKNLYGEIIAYLIPLLSILVLELIFYVPRSNEYWNFLRQTPFFVGIYFWQSQRPDTFSFFSAFVLGIFADVWSGEALGINILSFLLLYFLAVQVSLRFNVLRFSYSWLLFAGAMLITLLLKALMVSVFYRQFVSLGLLAVEYLLVVAMYPLLARVYIWVERRYIHLEERYEKV